MYFVFSLYSQINNVYMMFIHKYDHGDQTCADILQYKMPNLNEKCKYCCKVKSKLVDYIIYESKIHPYYITQNKAL